MNIRLFLDICEAFFEQMHSPFIEEEHNEIIHEKLDEEKGWRELSDDEDILCECNVCHLVRQILLYINPTIYKKNLNKND